MQDQRHPIRAFDPLLRDLVTWGLVARRETGTKRSWLLVDAAQKRLNELVGTSPPMPADKVLYLDRRCVDCGLRQLTRLHGGAYVCDTCSERRAAALDDAEQPLGLPAKAPRRGWWQERGGPAEPVVT